MKYDVGIIGLGYVGLTLATVMAEVGYKVVGIERHQHKVDLTNAGQPHLMETGLADALKRVIDNGRLRARTAFEPGESCDVYVITVGTPLDADGNARLDMISKATSEVAETMQSGALIVLRSTVRVSTAREVVKPILERSGKDFQIAMCPERTLEGRALKELRNLPQIIGADDDETRRRATALFRRITANIVEVSSLEAAEIIKLVDNTYRDVQFAFANEVARLCDAYGVNGYEVINLGKQGYSRTNVALPGLVGGPCLEKDPHILAESARQRGIALEITRAGRMVNERQPVETVAMISAEMARRGMPADTPVALLGMAFKGQPQTDDLRGSMSLKVLDALKAARPEAEMRLFDPVIAPESLARDVPGHRVASTLNDAIEGAGLTVIANNHPAFAEFSPADFTVRMRPRGFIYDYWNHYSAWPLGEGERSYYAVGNAGPALGDGDAVANVAAMPSLRSV